MFYDIFYVHHRQDLANILYTSGYVDEDEIRTHLELPAEFEFTETELPKPGTGQKLQQRELGILAWKTERADMRNFAITSLGCSQAEVSNITSDNRKTAGVQCLKFWFGGVAKKETLDK